jgi:transposase-like protein
MTLTALADRCPACGTENNSPPVEPYSVREDGDQVVARYRCPSCRCLWFTCWLTPALPNVSEDQHREEYVA